MHHYRAFGFTIESEFEIPDLIEAPVGATADVTIGRRRIKPIENERTGMQMIGPVAHFYIPEVGRYLIRDGTNIDVDPDPAAAERNVRLYLLGSAFGMILHQRRLLPLHANALVIDGGAVAFLGHPGAGKSTMAAWFDDRGHQMLTDDVCLVTGIEQGAPEASVGLPRIRLWREALEARGDDPGRYQRSFDDMDKYDVPAREPPRLLKAPLRALYVLGKATDAESAGVTRLQGSQAVDAVVANTYRGSYVPMLNAMPEYMQQCIALVRQVPVFSADRLWGHDVFGEQARTLEAHAQSIVRATTE
jgi:hypothetical protein